MFWLWAAAATWLPLTSAAATVQVIYMLLPFTWKQLSFEVAATKIQLDVLDSNTEVGSLQSNVAAICCHPKDGLQGFSCS